MPNLRLAATAIDQVASAREATIDAVTAFGDTELLCYRAEHPGDLVERQHAAWQPLLDWAARRFDAALCNTAGVMPRPQAPAALEALRAAVANYDDYMLAGLAFAVQTSGSLVIGLALAEERLDAAQAFDMAELDESYQIEQWGEDAEAAQRRATRRRDLQQAAAYMALVRNTPSRQVV
jgi:chaperone required for assembly of F1-ATPase